MKSFIFGTTSSGLPIPGYHFGLATDPAVLVLGGVHGDEPEGVEACLGLLNTWSSSFSLRLHVTLVPAFNVDGVLRSSRVNANGVDLNRNMMTEDWTAEIATPRYNPGPSANSEPEIRALVRWLDEQRPVFVLSMHSWHPMLNSNGDCGGEAEAMAELTGYEIKPSIGYPTPGCLGTYCGLERDIPTLTYEIERGLKTAEILKIHIPAILEGLKVTETTRQKTP